MGRVLALLAVVAVAVVFLAFAMQGANTDDAAPPSQDSRQGHVGLSVEEKVEEGVRNCVERNLSLNETVCRDITYHEIAMTENQAELCEKIRDQRIREHCNLYFDYKS